MSEEPLTTPKAPRFSRDQEAAIIDALKTRGVKGSCPRCGHEEFQLEAGFFVHVVQSGWHHLNLGGTVVPTVITACKRCGFIAEHAIGSLGLFDDPSFQTEPERHDEQ